MRGVSVISIVRDIWEGFDFTYILSILLSVVPSLICITLHELGHGYVAWRLGDDTAKRAGRLTLNPLKHIDTMGLLMMVCFHFGWAKPVPVNMYRFRNPKKGMAVTALAGPVTNLLLALVFMVLYFRSIAPQPESIYCRCSLSVPTSARALPFLICSRFRRWTGLKFFCRF